MKTKKKAKISTKLKIKHSSNRQGTKIQYKGVNLKSKLEVYCYKKLEEEGIKFTYEEITFELLPQITFIYNEKSSKTILPLTYTPDFVGKDFIIECKGYADKRFPVVWKLFKHYLYNNNYHYQLYKPMSLIQVDRMIEDIIRRRNEKN